MCALLCVVRMTPTRSIQFFLPMRLFTRIPYRGENQHARPKTKISFANLNQILPPPTAPFALANNA